MITASKRNECVMFIQVSWAVCVIHGRHKWRITLYKCDSQKNAIWSYKLLNNVTWVILQITPKRNCE